VLTIDLDRLAIEPGSRVLDLACGSGRHIVATRWISGVTGVGLDLGGDEVRATVETLENMDRTEPSEGGTARDAGPWFVVQGDTYRLPFEDECFEHVIAAEVLEHLHEDDAALNEMMRVLKPGGVLAVSVPRRGPEAVCWALSTEYHSNEGGHIRIYRRSELERKLAECGGAIFARHFAHALHSPYWWLKCLVGVRRDDSLPVRLYHRFLVWDMLRKPRLTRGLEQLLNPLIGKSMVFYARKTA
jgi:SAM-dependent methyltransferase